jgi:hypothetical protein
MQILLLAVILAAPAQNCGPAGASGQALGTRRQAPQAVNCPNYTPPARWYCKPCAGCAGQKCLATQQPYFGSAPYNYRVQFDYPWSMRPAYAMGQFSPVSEILEEVPVEGELIEPPPLDAGPLEEASRPSSSRKPRSTLRR